jgi:hypothetical protein
MPSLRSNRKQPGVAPDRGGAPRIHARLRHSGSHSTFTPFGSAPNPQEQPLMNFGMSIRTANQALYFRPARAGRATVRSHEQKLLPDCYSFRYSPSGIGKVLLFKTAPRIGVLVVCKFSAILRADSRRVEFASRTMMMPSQSLATAVASAN